MAGQKERQGILRLLGVKYALHGVGFIDLGLPIHQVSPLPFYI